jgi:hypothetical protein
MPNRRNHFIATLIYEEGATAKRACAALQLAAHCSKRDAHWDINPWRLDVLRSPVAWDEALREAADANLIAVAVSGVHSFPAPLMEWLECWAKGRHVGNAALAVIRDRGEEEPSSSTARNWSRFTARHGLDLIIDAGRTSDVERPDAFRNLVDRNWLLPAKSLVAISASIHDPNRHWGINE